MKSQVIDEEKRKDRIIFIMFQAYNFGDYGTLPKVCECAAMSC